jgi:hypothetical protein
MHVRALKAGDHLDHVGVAMFSVLADFHFPRQLKPEERGTPPQLTILAFIDVKFASDSLVMC